LLIAGAVFRQRLHALDWAAALVMTAGVAILLYALSPTMVEGAIVTGVGWWVGLPANTALIALLVAGSRGGSPRRAAALLGVAAGSAFGMTVASVKTMTTALSRGGLAGALTTWQTYVMVLTGALGVFLLQAAFNAGPLTMAQPGITIADPVVSVLRGVLGYGEAVRTIPATHNGLRTRSSNNRGDSTSDQGSVAATCCWSTKPPPNHSAAPSPSAMVSTATSRV